MLRSLCRKVLSELGAVRDVTVVAVMNGHWVPHSPQVKESAGK